MEQIVDKFLAEVNAQLQARKVTITLSPAARTQLAHKGYDPKYGARPLARLLQTDVKDPLADEILFGKLAKGGRVRVDAQNGALAFEFETK